MNSQLVATVTLDLQPQLQWMWWSERSAGFIVGDERKAFALPASNPSAPLEVSPPRPCDPPSSCNLPITESHYDEFIAEPRRGFLFLERSACEHALDDKGRPVGDLLRTIVFGPDYGQYVLHPATGLILGLRGGSIELLQRSGDGFKALDRTKTRGRSALAFAAHPNQPLIAYGDNYGAFYAHRFDETKFTKASKIADKTRKASRVEFVSDGQKLILGGMGYLAVYSFVEGKFALLHEISIPVRDFIYRENGGLILVNQGLNGIGAYRYDSTGFTPVGATRPDQAVHQIAVSKCMNYLAVSFQGSPTVAIYCMAGG